MIQTLSLYKKSGMGRFKQICNMQIAQMKKHFEWKSCHIWMPEFITFLIQINNKGTYNFYLFLDIIEKLR